MLKWLMHRGFARFERQWDYDASCVHAMVEADSRAAWLFQRAASLGKYRSLVQTSMFEIEDEVVKAIDVVRNPDKLRHLLPSQRQPPLTRSFE
jgi:hypothetical protein